MPSAARDWCCYGGGGYRCVGRRIAIRVPVEIVQHGGARLDGVFVVRLRLRGKMFASTVHVCINHTPRTCASCCRSGSRRPALAACSSPTRPLCSCCARGHACPEPAAAVKMERGARGCAPRKYAHNDFLPGNLAGEDGSDDAARAQSVSPTRTARQTCRHARPHTRTHLRTKRVGMPCEFGGAKACRKFRLSRCMTRRLHRQSAVASSRCCAAAHAHSSRR
jgi:hypothetical protein